MLLFLTADTLINPRRNCCERELITLPSDWDVPIVRPHDWAICYELFFCFFFMFITVEVRTHINRCWLLVSWLCCCSVPHPSILLWFLISNGGLKLMCWKKADLLLCCEVDAQLFSPIIVRNKVFGLIQSCLTELLWTKGIDWIGAQLHQTVLPSLTQEQRIKV